MNAKLICQILVGTTGLCVAFAHFLHVENSQQRANASHEFVEACKRAVAGGDSRVKFDDLVQTMNWDGMAILQPYSSQDDISNIVGIRCKLCEDVGLRMRDDIFVVALTLKGQPVLEFEVRQQELALSPRFVHFGVFSRINHPVVAVETARGKIELESRSKS